MRFAKWNDRQGLDTKVHARVNTICCPICGFRASVMSWLLALWNKDYRRQVIREIARQRDEG